MLRRRAMRDPARHVLATDANFEEPLYLAANPDVMRHVERGGSGWTHFDRHGRREGRVQLRPEAAGLVGSRQARKYARFRATLDPARGAGGAFAFLDEAEAFPIGYGGAAHAIGDYDAESANPGFADFIAQVAADPHGLYADIGCGRRDRTFDNCLYVEVYRSLSADLVMAPACRYPIADASLDGIGCFAVMEHMAEPWVAAAEFRRMLKPGGLVFIDYPFLVPVHGYPSHYYNATRAGLARLFDEGFETIALGTRDNQTPAQALHWQLGALVEAIADESLRAEVRAASVAQLIDEPAEGGLWARIMAAVPEPARGHLAAGNTLVARRIG